MQPMIRYRGKKLGNRRIQFDQSQYTFCSGLFSLTSRTQLCSMCTRFINSKLLSSLPILYCIRNVVGIVRNFSRYQINKLNKWDNDKRKESDIQEFLTYRFPLEITRRSLFTISDYINNSDVSRITFQARSCL